MAPATRPKNYIIHEKSMRIKILNMKQIDSFGIMKDESGGWVCIVRGGGKPDREKLFAFCNFPAALSLVHPLAMSAGKRWRRLRGFRHLADVRFINGVEEKETGRRAAGFRTAIHNI